MMILQMAAAVILWAAFGFGVWLLAVSNFKKLERANGVVEGDLDLTDRWFEDDFFDETNEGGLYDDPYADRDDLSYDLAEDAEGHLDGIAAVKEAGAGR